MPAYKNKESGSWYVVTQYTDWTGERKQKCKRGFSTRREALEWEQKFQQQSAGDLDMSFEAFVEIYTSDLKARLKESTWQTKEHIIKTKIIPYFGKRKINEITTKDVIAWQNELLAYRDKKHNSATSIRRITSPRKTQSLSLVWLRLTFWVRMVIFPFIAPHLPAGFSDQEHDSSDL